MTAKLMKLPKARHIPVGHCEIVTSADGLRAKGISKHRLPNGTIRVLKIKMRILPAV